MLCEHSLINLGYKLCQGPEGLNRSGLGWSLLMVVISASSELPLAWCPAVDHGPWTVDHAITEPLAPLQAPRTLKSHSYALNLHLDCIEEEARCLIEAGDALVTSKHTVLYKTKKTTFIC